MHVRNEIIGNFVIKLQQINVELRIKTPFAPIDEIRLFVS